MITVLTDHPIALDSRDHLKPWGAVNDSYTSEAFLDGLELLFGSPSVLDLGCAGGGFVASCLKRGWKAIGIEGSDVPKNQGLHEWPKIPLSLFTADITKEFSACEELESKWGTRCRNLFFDVITAWEVLEHIKEPNLGAVFENVSAHMHRDSVWFMSVSRATEYYHRTVKDVDWWKDKLLAGGFRDRHDVLQTFKPADFVRNHLNTADSFHLAVSLV